MNNHRLLLLTAFVIGHSVFDVQAAPPPPELTVLRQQYEKVFAERVTAVHEANVATLDAKFTTALDNAIAQAKSAGDLPTVLAIQGDKKLLADKQPLPADDDQTPEPLKKLRAIYRDQLGKLTEQKTANTTALLTPYAAKLQALEATLTKNDRLDEAKEVMDYRAGLKADAPVPAVAAATPSTPSTPPASAADDPKLPKGDDRAAAEWVLSVGGSVFIKEGVKPGYAVKSAADLPKGKFQLFDFTLNGKTAKGPVTGENLKVVAGLKDLRSFTLDYIELSDEELSFIGTFPSLEKLEISHNSLFTGTAVKHLVPLRSLTGLNCFTSSFNDGAVALLADCRSLTHVMLGSSEFITNACIPLLNQLPKLQTLSLGGTKVTTAGLAQITAKLDGLGLTLVSGESISPQVSMLAAKQPQLNQVMLSHEIPDDSLLLLQAFPKLTYISVGGRATEALLEGLSAVPGLTHFYGGSLLPITDAGLMKFVSMKKLKKLGLSSPLLTDAGIAAFKKQRPDIQFYR